MTYKCFNHPKFQKLMYIMTHLNQFVLELRKTSFMSKSNVYNIQCPVSYSPLVLSVTGGMS